MEICAKFILNAWKLRTVAFGVLLPAAWAAAACTNVTSQMDPSGAWSAGAEFKYAGIDEPLTPEVAMWGSLAGPVMNVYQGCSAGAVHDVHMEPELSVYYEDDGGGEAALFNLNASVAIRFWISVMQEDGTWRGWQRVLSNGVDLSIPVRDGNARIRMDYQLVAKEDVGGNSSLETPRYQWKVTNAADGAGTYGRSVSALYLQKYVPPPEPSCSFSSRPPSKVEMSHTTVSMLERDGSGPASEFRWSFSCNSTALGADMIYKPGTAYSGRPDGRMAIESGAGATGGVEFEVRRATSSGVAKVPVRFGRAYSRGKSGTEYLDVRYVPTGDPLKAGEGKASLTVELGVY